MSKKVTPAQYKNLRRPPNYDTSKIKGWYEIPYCPVRLDMYNNGGTRFDYKTEGRVREAFVDDAGMHRASSACNCARCIQAYIQ